MESAQNYNQIILYGGTMAMLLMAASIAIFIYLYQRKLIKKKLEFQAVNDQLKERELTAAYDIMQAQDEERKRIAADIHDNLGSIMVTLTMYADSLTSDRPDKERIAEKISEVANLAAKETRKVSHQLHSGVLQHFGLKSALTDLKETVGGTSQVNFNLDYPQDIPMSTELAINLYRVCQELVNNSLKHSKAKTLNFKVEQANEQLVLEYSDDGIGFDPEKVKKGLGLNGIEARIRPYNGKIAISSPSRGAFFRIRIPYGEHVQVVTG